MVTSDTTDSKKGVSGTLRPEREAKARKEKGCSGLRNSLTEYKDYFTMLYGFPCCCFLFPAAAKCLVNIYYSI